MFKPRVVYAVLVLALLWTLAPPTAFAGSGARIVRLSYLDGGVEMDRGDGRGFDRAILNMPVVEGTRLATGNDGFAEIEFEAGSALRLTPNSSITFRALALRGSGDKVTMSELQAGLFYFNVKKSGGDDFRILVGGQQLSVRKSARFRISSGRDDAQIAVFKGEVELAGAAQPATVRKNETLSLDLRDPGRYFLARGVSAAAYDTWDTQRDQYQARYASARGYRGYSSAYRYGVSDLNYYGSYSNLPGWGSVWRPYSAGYGWDPFMDGAWVWYPGWGYTWVSSYPWGWMPYRYGRWVYVPGHGWYWQPGSQWHSWYSAPVVHNPPPAYRAPAPPPTPPARGRDHVVPVGRGPFTGDPGARHDRMRAAENSDRVPGREQRQDTPAGAASAGASVATPAHLPVLTPGLAPGPGGFDRSTQREGEAPSPGRMREADRTGANDAPATNRAPAADSTLPVIVPRSAPVVVVPSAPVTLQPAPAPRPSPPAAAPYRPSGGGEVRTAPRSSFPSSAPGNAAPRYSPPPSRPPRSGGARPH